MARRSTIHQAVTSRKAAKPLGPTVHGVLVERPGETLYVSGQIPIEVPNGRVFTGDIKRQAELAFSHLRSIVLDAKFSMDEVVRVTVYLVDLQQLATVDGVYRKQFVGASLPARTVVQVAALPEGVAVQVDAVAVKVGKSADDLFSDDDFK